MNEDMGDGSEGISLRFGSKSHKQRKDVRLCILLAVIQEDRWSSFRVMITLRLWQLWNHNIWVIKLLNCISRMLPHNKVYCCFEFTTFFLCLNCAGFGLWQHIFRDLWLELWFHISSWLKIMNHYYKPWRRSYIYPHTCCQAHYYWKIRVVL